MQPRFDRWPLAELAEYVQEAEPGWFGCRSATRMSRVHLIRWAEAIWTERERHIRRERHLSERKHHRHVK